MDHVSGGRSVQGRARHTVLVVEVSANAGVPHTLLNPSFSTQIVRKYQPKKMKSTIELKHLALDVSLGSYGPDDVVPDHHLLDLTLEINPSLILIEVDDMDRVFDYDPLVLEIDRLAKDGHYHTQEWLMTRIVAECATYDEIETVDISLSKRPVLPNTGTLGVRLFVGAEELRKIRYEASER